MVGPEPFLGSCQVCGGRVGWPPQPLTARALVKFLDFAMELHADCSEDDADRRSDVLVGFSYERTPAAAAVGMN